MIGLIAGPMKYVLAAMAIALLLAGGALKWALAGKRAAEDELTAYRAQAVAVIEERLRAQQQADAENARTAQRLKDTHAKDLAAVAARYAAGLAGLRSELAAARERAGLPAAPAAPGGADGADPLGRLVAALERCEAAVRRLDALQRWERERR